MGESSSKINSEYRSGFAALVGPPNAGKSTLLNSFLGAKVSIVSPKPQTTRNRIIGIKQDENSQIVFVDTPGFLSENKGGGKASRLGKALHRSLTDAVVGVDVLVLVIDGKQASFDLEMLEKIEGDIKRFAVDSPTIIVINKIDLFRKARLLPLMAKLHDIFVKDPKHLIEIVPVSATTGDGLDILEEEIRRKLPFGPAYFPRGTLTEQTEEFFASEIIREKLFLYLNQEIPYSVAVKINQWLEKKDKIYIQASIIVERGSQKGIVIGDAGKKLKSVGTAARVDLERALGTSVFLDLHVAVEPNWTRSAEGLTRAGLNYGS